MTSDTRLIALTLGIGMTLAAAQGPAPPRQFPQAVNLEDTSETSANVSMGDLDGDGDLDLVLAKGRHWPLVDRVLLNNGRGEFVASDLSPTPDRSYSAVLTDVDGDRALDLVISNDRPDSKLVYVNDGKARFRRAGTWGSPEWTTRNAAAADLNGDGWPDIIAANRGGQSYVCLNDGAGRFDARPCIVIAAESATIIVPGDFNHDGAIDLAVPHRDGGQSRIFLNDGQAGFTRTLAFGPPVTNARAAAAGDLNGDGWLDLVVGDERTGTRVYLNDRRGALAGGAALGDATLAPGAIAVADMNRDGLADVVIGHAGAPGALWFNDGGGGRFTEVRFGDGRGAVYGVAVGDLNGDGYPDIATAKSDAPNVMFFSSSGVMRAGLQTPAPPQAAPVLASTRLAPTPPMGFNTWNKFGCNVSEQLIRETADAMVATGMRDAGYRYVVIDDCWQVSRGADGRIVADPQRFPSGMKALADYVHGKGLQFGLYTDLGPKTCEGRPGSFGYHDIDASTYADWTVDYIKVDWCNADDLDARAQYTRFRDALRRTGRPILLSICEWGRNRPWEWAADVGQLWRTTSDIRDNWDSVVWILNANDLHAGAAGPGHWNDPDMLEVGNGGMTFEEYKAHFSLWAIMAAPLLTGNDLRSMTEDTKSILLNPEVIAVDQDPLGVQGRKVLDRGYGAQVWMKPLADGSRAVAVLNLAAKEADLYLRWADIGLPPGAAAVRDLWAHRDLPTHTDTGTRFDERLTLKVAAHGVVLLRISPR